MNMTDDVLSLRDFSEINVDDNFFDDLKARYSGFEDWFERKSLLGEKAYTVFEGSKIIAFGRL